MNDTAGADNLFNLDWYLDKTQETYDLELYTEFHYIINLIVGR